MESALILNGSEGSELIRGWKKWIQYYKRIHIGFICTVGICTCACLQLMQRVR